MMKKSIIMGLVGGLVLTSGSLLTGKTSEARSAYSSRYSSQSSSSRNSSTLRTQSSSSSSFQATQRKDYKPKHTLFSQTEEGCFIDQFVQPDEKPVGKVDILFIVDTSYSLVDERTRVARGLDNLVKDFPFEVDYQIGVLLAHSHKSSYGGKLFQAGSEPVVLSNQKLSLAQIQGYLEDKLTLASSKYNERLTDGGEAGLFSLYAALTPTYLPYNQGKGFFRSDAALAVIFVSDENDLCAQYPAGVTRVADPDNLEASAYKLVCAPSSVNLVINEEYVYNYVNKRLNEPRLMIGGVLYNDVNSVPAVGENEYGYGYMELIERSGGTSVDIGSSDYSTGLADLGGLVKKMVELEHDFTLSQPEVDEATIEATVDGASEAHTYEPSTNVVHLEYAGGANSIVEISYCQIKPGPKVISVTPNQGYVTGGDVVIISGENFESGAIAEFDGLSCGGLTYVNSTTLTCTNPAHAAGPVDVRVVNPDGKDGIGSGAFTYIEKPPVAISINPNSGPVTGGTVVTITGEEFRSGAVVSIGGASCGSLTVVSASEIQCTTSAHIAQTVDVVITNDDGQTATLIQSYTYVELPPEFELIQPNSGSENGGTLVTISGQNLLNGVSVSIGGQSCTGLVFVSSSEVQCRTAAHAPAVVDVVITNPDGQSVTAVGAYTYLNEAPVITKVIPNEGPVAGGILITVQGQNFDPGMSILFGTSLCSSVTVVSGVEATCTLPPHGAGLVDVSVKNTDTQTGVLIDGFTYKLPPPSVLSITPNKGDVLGNLTVTIVGFNFDSSATVNLGGANCSNVVVATDGQSLTCRTSSHAIGIVDVNVTNPDAQTGTLPSGFEYTDGIIIGG